jgi:predicted nucleic acid-binding protein
VSYLLDTNVVSELRRPQPQPRVLSFIAAAALDDLYLSDVTMAELRFGIERVSDPLKRAEITSWLDHVLRPMFGRRVLPITEDVILRWRLMVEAGAPARPHLFATRSVHRRHRFGAWSHGRHPQCRRFRGGRRRCS